MSSFHHPVPSPISVAAAEEEGAAHLLRTLEAAAVGQTYGLVSDMKLYLKRLRERFSYP